MLGYVGPLSPRVTPGRLKPSCSSNSCFSNRQPSKCQASSTARKHNQTLARCHEELFPQRPAGKLQSAAGALHWLALLARGSQARSFLRHSGVEQRRACVPCRATKLLRYLSAKSAQRSRSRPPRWSIPHAKRQPSNVLLAATAY